MFLDAPAGYRLDAVVTTSFIGALPPLRYDGPSGRLHLALRTPGGPPRDAVVTVGKGGVRVAGLSGAAAPLLAQLRAALRLDEDFSLLHRAAEREPQLRWVRDAGAGPLLRSPSAYEDLVKALIVGRLGRRQGGALIERLCRLLGPAAPSGLRAFPDAEEMAAAPPSAYARYLEAGPLAVPLRALALRCRDDLYPEALRRAALPTPPAPPSAAALADLTAQATEWEERIEALLLSLPGFGVRAAELLLPLLGCYDVFLYSGRLRARFARAAGEAPRSLVQRLARFGPYRGLALYLAARGPGRAGPAGNAARSSRTRKKTV